MTTLRFHFDFLSPYAYLATKQLPALAARHGATIEAVPTLLAPLLAHGGTKGPAEIPAKRVYLLADVLRTSHLLGLPLRPPPAHPFNPLLPLRVCTAVPAPARFPLVEALYDAVWGRGEAIDTEASLRPLLAARGLDADALLAAARSDETKGALRAAVDEAIAAGVFGVPTVRVSDQLFFGYDSFGHLDAFLAGRLPDFSAELQAWRHVGASAQRRV